MRARPWRRRIHFGSLSSFGRILGSLGSFGVIYMPPRCRRVHLGSCVHSGAPLRSLSSFGLSLGVVGFIRTPWVSFGFDGSFLRALGTVGFIRVRPGGYRIQSGALWMFTVSFGFVGLTLER